ncbi:Ig-like domain-containing protein [Paraferrimonas sp. SM1919]|uniref:Ig-like domain-containing protein n=1 Tax=Paraferrimonas sp. SM1919 TaxID=2662263 RepID=UPI0013D004E4|nr:Ig-like domain-containing protein [Paraferrimonas sp. SM1919]
MKQYNLVFLTALILTGCGGNSEISIDQVNTPPTAQSMSLSVKEDQKLTAQLLGDDEDKFDTLTYALATLPANGDIELNQNTGEFSYVPAPDYNGSDSFTYTVSDGFARDVADVKIDVEAVNDSPVIEDQYFSFSNYSTFSAQLIATDIDSEILTFSISEQPQVGGVVITDEGRFTYTPDSTESHTALFTVEVSDGEDSATAQISVEFIKPSSELVLDDVEISLFEQAFQLQFTGGNGGELQFESDNNAVATVNESGWVSLSEVGVSTIRITELASQHYDSQTVEATLTVTPIQGSGESKPLVLVLSLKKYGSEPYSINYTGGNGGNKTVEVLDSNIAEFNVDLNKLIIKNAGSTAITLTEAASNGFDSQSSTGLLIVNQAELGDEVFTPLVSSNINKSYGESDFSIAYTGGNGGLVSVVSNNEEVISVNQNTGLATIANVGTASVTLMEAATTNYAAHSITINIIVGQSSKGEGAYQDIILNDQEVMYGQNSFVYNHTGGNGGTLSFESSDPSIASIDSSTGIVNLHSVGVTTITVEEAATEQFEGQDAQAVLTVLKAGPQSPAFTALSATGLSVKYGAMAQSLTVTGGNGGAISYASDNTDVATVDANGLVTFGNAGVVTITVTEATTDNFLAQEAEATITVAQLTVTDDGYTSLSFADASYEYGEVFTPTVTGGNGGTLSYSSSNSSIVSISAAGELEAVGVGAANITVTEKGSNNYASQSVTAELIISKTTISNGNVTLISAADINASYGSEPVQIEVQDGNGGNLSYQSANTNIATVDNNGLVTIHNAGNTQITITEAETDFVAENYTMAQINVNKAQSGDTIYNDLSSVNALKRLNQDAFYAYFEGGNGGDLRYSSSDEDIAYISNEGLISILALGETEITITELESTNFAGQATTFTLTIVNPIAVFDSLEVHGYETNFDDAKFIEEESSGEFGIAVFE